MKTEEKFKEAKVTSDGSERGYVDFQQLETLWFNTGSQCNIDCENCYMESSPTNDTLVYLSKDEILSYVEEGQKLFKDFHTVGLTGGEPFLNKDIIPIIKGVLEKRLKVLVLSNAMKPLERRRSEIKDIANTYGDNFTIRVSLDHHSKKGHDAERGSGSFDITLKQLQGLSNDGVQLNIAGRSLSNEDQESAIKNYYSLFESHNINIAEEGLTIFPEMEIDNVKSPEITTKCWSLLNFDPNQLMCAKTRMVIKRKNANHPTVVACTLLPYDSFFDYGPDLGQSLKRTYLKHIYCSQFCVLGGASCS